MRSISSPASAGFAGQLTAAAGAVLALLGTFGAGFEYAGVALLAIGTVISAPDAGTPGPFLEEWWTILAAGTLACLVGVVLALLVSVVGAVVLSLGAIVALVSVGLGAPPGGD